MYGYNECEIREVCHVCHGSGMGVMGGRVRGRGHLCAR